ncbi:hypothetical protein GMOD_00002512 [Pyrenophora seminiperda CCB06]|uniref:Uncharacterized protein n=1 Tax=Pyrenophora seminiperda CCB06 TaxID=1302712 RepID=A0A3M7M2G8_9PLEO|nr:hypothetical protein GMOD_00002512 [Pyrenophora seminiperda CCB06]
MLILMGRTGSRRILMLPNFPISNKFDPAAFPSSLRNLNTTPSSEVKPAQLQ